jgi:cytochrome c
MKAVVVALAVTAGLGLSQATLADEALAKSAGCLACHNVEGAKKMGASFKDISAKSKGKVDADALAAKIGNKPHPAVKASPEDQKKLAAYILSL